MNIVDYSRDISIKRSVDQGTGDQRRAVEDILARVKAEGDTAVDAYTRQFDGADLSSETRRVTEKEIQTAYEKVDQETLAILREAKANITRFHERQQRQTWITTEADGTILGQKITPLDAVGIYVPGGRASYPSTILMNAIPAIVAGVSRIVMVSPPQADGSLNDVVLVTASELGIKEIYKTGGAQAVGALAYGTETVEPVDKIVGPGNIYVALAKQLVYGTVDIDMFAGPSEIVVLADSKARADYIAADMLSQAEHDPMASAVLVTPDRPLAERVAAEVESQLATLPKKEIAGDSIRDFGAIYVTATLDEAVEAVNELAPEHLEIQTEAPFDLIGSIRHAGAIFLGENSSEPVGDYFAGPNHVLPTNGTARFSSPLNVDDFTKKSSILSYSRKAVEENAAKIATFARLEGLEAHARAVEKRLEGNPDDSKTD
ncbi:histidinol dehydrogenase [Alteribacter natronophilus]|uniref:histidinol dehydrogenase n=1 Tax=Alteribacter natronophilus TaxID=2583810 RepID=UPI00110F15FA|nr:histidinol dehydrogenase [Alteribacter natronophilus]TMW72412.1 histidinol dehydrogenase [Alteribacter natronophilus]